MLRTGCITLLTICAIFKFGAVHADSVQNGSESRQEKENGISKPAEKLRDNAQPPAVVPPIDPGIVAPIPSSRDQDSGINLPTERKFGWTTDIQNALTLPDPGCRHSHFQHRLDMMSASFPKHRRHHV